MNYQQFPPQHQWQAPPQPNHGGFGGMSSFPPPPPNHGGMSSFPPPPPNHGGMSSFPPPPPNHGGVSSFPPPPPNQGGMPFQHPQSGMHHHPQSGMHQHVGAAPGRVTPSPSPQGAAGMPYPPQSNIGMSFPPQPNQGGMTYPQQQQQQQQQQGPEQVLQNIANLKYDMKPEKGNKPPKIEEYEMDFVRTHLLQGDTRPKINLRTVRLSNLMLEPNNGTSSLHGVVMKSHPEKEFLPYGVSTNLHLLKKIVRVVKKNRLDPNDSRHDIFKTVIVEIKKTCNGPWLEKRVKDLCIPSTLLFALFLGEAFDAMSTRVDRTEARVEQLERDLRSLQQQQQQQQQSMQRQLDHQTVHSLQQNGQLQQQFGNFKQEMNSTNDDIYNKLRNTREDVDEFTGNAVTVSAEEAINRKFQQAAADGSVIELE